MKRNKSIWGLVSALLILSMLTAFALAQQAPPTPGDPSGDGVVPIIVEGNPDCGVLNADPRFPGITTDFGFKIQGSTNGVYPFDASVAGTTLTGGAPSDPNNSVTISNSNGLYFDWAATLGIDAVIVKASNDANVFVYTPEDFADTDLHGPINPANGQPFGVSHIEFCYDYELTVSKDATASQTISYDWDITKDPDETYIGEPGDSWNHEYIINLDGTVTPGPITVEGTITIENNTPFDATITDVEDELSGGIVADVDCGEDFNIVLPAGDTLECTYSATLPNDNDRTNTASVTTMGDVGGGSATVDVVFAPPTIVGEDEVNVTDDYGTPGDDTDDKDWGPFSDDEVINYTRVFSCPELASEYDENGYYEDTVINTATIVETEDFDKATVIVKCQWPDEELDVTKTAVTTYTRTWDWDITKGPDGDYDGVPGDVFPHTYDIAVDGTYTDSDWAVSGTITIENNTPFDATITNVTDVVTTLAAEMNAPVVCPKPYPITLEAGDDLVCTYDLPLGQGMNGENTATVTTSGFVDGGTHTVPVIFGNTPTEEFNKEVNVTDDFGTPGVPGDDKDFGPWQDGDSGSYDRDFICPTSPTAYVNGVYTETVINTAEIDETGDKDTATVTLTCTYDPQSLTVNKTAVPTFTRTWNWDITKGPDADYAGEPGDSWLHNYLIEVEKVGYTDSGWAVFGEITIKNNTPFDATIENVSDYMDATSAEIDVPVDCPEEFPYILAAGEELVCTYSTSLQNGLGGVNTATVTTSGFVGGGSDDADFSFITPTTKVNETVNVVDDFGTPLNAGDDLGFGPFANTGEVGYERPFSCPTDESMYVNGLYEIEVVNTATIDETGQSDDATVTVTCRIPPVVNVCPVDAAVYERTDLIGQGMGSNVKAVGVRKVLIPNSDDVLELYGQLAGKDQRKWRYARFIRPNGTYINDKTLESPAYRTWAVFWYGQDLTPATLPHWRARLVGAPTSAPFVQRAFILYPTYRTEEQYVNVWETFDESAENHVFWEDFNGWIPEQQQVIEIPAPLLPTDMVVKVAVVDNDRDNRPFEMTISAGGVSQFVSFNGPTNGDLLNIVEVTLQGVPAGTSEIVIDLVSPAEIGDSVAMTGATAYYLCPPVENGNDR